MPFSSGRYHSHVLVHIHPVHFIHGSVQRYEYSDQAEINTMKILTTKLIMCAIYRRGSRGGQGGLAPPPPHKKLLPLIVRRGSRGAKRALPPPLGQEGLGPPLQNPGSAYDITVRLDLIDYRRDFCPLITLDNVRHIPVRLNLIEEIFVHWMPLMIIGYRDIYNIYLHYISIYMIPIISSRDIGDLPLTFG